MATLDYHFRLQKTQWDFGPGVGVQWAMAYHQYIDADGNSTDPGTPGGSWEPFIPGPVIRGNVGDTLRIRIHNIMSDPHNHFVEALKEETTVHWHGLELSNAHDGTTVTQRPIHAYDDFVYKFKLLRPGVFWYHPHWDSMIQTSLGLYGAIVVEDANHQALRAQNIIPHQDRTFNISLMDISFQADRGSESTSPHVPLGSIESTSPVYIRNTHHLPPGAGAQNFGDVQIINGKHNIPFNDANGNFQQFWYKGERNTAGPIQVHEGEGLSFELLNTGLHRFYKIHLAYKTSPQGNWIKSDHLYRIGGEGGLLEHARAGGGVFGDFKIRGRRGRTSNGGGQGLNNPQSSSEFTPGEFLLSESSRITVAFRIEANWHEVALRASGFSIVGNAGNADELPDNMIIAHFTNIGTNPSPDYLLPVGAIGPGTDLLAALGVSLEDLSTETAVTSFDLTVCSKSDLAANGVIVPDGPIMADYNLDLSRTPGVGPNIDDIQAFWTDEGPKQPTFDNTRYVKKGDVVEWTVETRTSGGDHPFHIHGFAFQPIKMELNDGSDNYTTLYTWDFVEYVDSIYVPYAHKLTFRFKVEDRPYIGEDDVEYQNGVLGRWLGHCHIFKHAHNGMMMNFFVVDDCQMETQKPDIYIRDKVDDDGTEPYVGGVNSLDIIVISSQVANGQTAFGTGSGTENLDTFGNELELGQDNYIYVRFSNRTSLPGEATADLYWSPISTLLYPPKWKYLGETQEVMVPDENSLMVAPPLTWASNKQPTETGAYAVVAIAGSQTDKKPLTTYDVYRHDGFNMVWSNFFDFLKKYNNVTYRYITAVDEQFFIPPICYKFRFRGAFDIDRTFDMVFTNRFSKTSIELTIPNEKQFQSALSLAKQRYTIDGGDLKIQMAPNSTFTMAELLLEKDKDYLSCFIIPDDSENIAELSPVAIQQFVAEKGERIEVGRVSWEFFSNQLKGGGGRKG